MSAPAVEIDGLSKRYGAVQALQGLSFAVRPGEIFGLIGPNGAGKTTAIECLLGLVEPDHGQIRVFGLDARTHPDAIRRRVGAQLHASALPDAMSPRQALRLCGAFYADAASPDELLERFALTDKASARFSSLSAGQRQRLALALAFVNRPDVVVLDEPTAALDPPARQELHALIAAQRAAGRTVLFTTHYLEEARTLCDRVAFIDHGRIQALDTPAALISRSRIRPRLMVRTNPQLTAAQIDGLPGIRGASREAEAWALETESVNEALAALTALIAAHTLELTDVSIRRPTLDDVFLEMTGRAPASAQSEFAPVDTHPNPKLR